MRAGVPRAIFEENSKMGVVKIGTDVQVAADKFPELLKFYREAAKVGVRYCLFGHFGDAHLHFNYMPTKEESTKCLEQIQKLYDNVYSWKGSPFAEHGIGLLKQKDIRRFHGKNQLGRFEIYASEHFFLAPISEKMLVAAHDFLLLGGFAAQSQGRVAHATQSLNH